ncbi:MAG: hypothetical protein JWM19_870 [Actinomycetia bacterium]|nr:hypothetical protein [Actinomycetes bacterium]
MSGHEDDSARMGARIPAGTSSGCATCGHPFALHGNGRTQCKAFACSAGPTVECTDCGGVTRDLATGEACQRCEGKGSVTIACVAFVHEAPALRLVV